ncbi:MAG: restriction endonuclease subunit S, partial [Prevotellaceae bacterium]|jgi:type I restriction enzyme M protein|nr:restriction endonuclease subunit S [Prevotellaceae bacterium]
LPIDNIVQAKIQKGIKDEFLPHIIDYAAGSGHFITESMHTLQQLLDNLDSSKLFGDTKRFVDKAKAYPYEWAIDYVYGIEKDYRLVKVGKVGCYLHGDGLARVIHSDGLGNFKSTKEYKILLVKTDKDFPQENKQFDILVSNPPYSVSAFKNNASKFYGKNDFELYNSLTDNSSEIECLFVERTKQLLKDGGVAGVILPSSILSNDGIYAKAREIILQYFEIVAITELGSNTFMATGTNTVVLFLRRRNNYDSINLRKSVERFFDDYQDVTRNGIEKPVAEYVNHVWENITVDDYITLLKKEPSNLIANHEIYKEYRKKIKAKTEKDFWNTLIETEKEKLYYFILAYPQKVVLVKTGEKDAEKRFLGYEFSNRRGSEGIHPVRRGKTIDECTQLFDGDSFDNPEKASAYIYKAFSGDYDFPVHESLKDNISRVRLVDMLTFDRESFAKNISTAVKKKVRYDDIWGTNILVSLNDIAVIQKGTSITKEKTVEGNIPVVAGGKEPAYFHNIANRNGNVITISASGAYSGFVNYFAMPIFASDCNTIHSKDEKSISTKLIFLFLKLIQEEIYDLQRGQAQPHVYADDLAKIQIPFLPKEIQQQIVSEIEVLEKKEAEEKEKIDGLKKSISIIIEKTAGVNTKLQDITIKIGSGATPLGGGGVYKNHGITFIRSQNVYDSYFLEEGLAYIDEEQAEKLDNVTVEKNDILFNITGASIARCCVVDEKYLPARVNQHVSIIRTSEKALPKYVQLMLVSKEYKDILLQIGEGATSRQAITKSQLENFSISLPPLSEQQKIVAEIEKIEAEIAESQKIVDEMLSLKNEVLKKYL